MAAVLWPDIVIGLDGDVTITFGVTQSANTIRVSNHRLIMPEILGKVNHSSSSGRSQFTYN